MRIFKLLLVVLLCSVSANARVLTGVECLRDMDFVSLKGKRVGLITNPTGIDSNLKSTIDILNEAEGVELVALFSPEHGIRGNYSAGKTVSDEVDLVTGVKVYSLHGANLSPTPEMLKGIDVLVYDIQDIGSRSYTYISTMGRSMVACAKAGVEFTVLDRPNPLGGIKVEGPLVEKNCESFVSQYPVPYIYGLTPGEFARLLCGENLLGLGNVPELTVIEMKGWERDMLFKDTGLPWVLPSPNIPTSETSFYYPATGIAGELNGCSIGVGYTLPFKFFAAPGVDGIKLSKALNSLNIPGVKFRPVAFRPYFSKFAGTGLSGVEVYITDPISAELTLIQFFILQEVYRLYPKLNLIENEPDSRQRMLDKVTGNSGVRINFLKRHKVEDILPIWNKDREEFIKVKSKYHIY